MENEKKNAAHFNAVDKNTSNPTAFDVWSLGFLILAFIISVVGLLVAIGFDTDDSQLILAAVSTASNLYGIFLIIVPWFGGSVPPLKDGYIWTPVKIIFFIDLAIEALLTVIFLPLVACQLGFFDMGDGKCADSCYLQICKILDIILGYFAVQFVAKILIIKAYVSQPLPSVLPTYL